MPEAPDPTDPNPHGEPMPDLPPEDDEAMADTERSPLCAWLAAQTHDEVTR